MYDIFHNFGSDIEVSSSGDLALSAGTDVTNQRVYRRLLTNPGDYLWNLNYGGGLAQFIGMPVSTADIEAVVSTQLALEAAISATPAAQVSVALANAADGCVVANIVYADPSSASPISLTVTAG